MVLGDSDLKLRSFDSVRETTLFLIVFADMTLSFNSPARLKYKHIHSAIHNFGHSFTSLINYVDNDYVIDELTKIHTQGNDIEVDWLTGSFTPENLTTPRIQKSIGYWRDSLEKHLASQKVDLPALSQLKFLAQ